MLSARMIKALCAVLHNDKKCRDSGLALLEAFDEIDLAVLATTAAAHAAGKKASPVQTLMELIRSELDRRFVGSDPRYQQQPGIVSQRLASARQNTGVKANPVVRAKPGGSATAAYEFRDNPRVKRCAFHNHALANGQLRLNPRGREASGLASTFSWHFIPRYFRPLGIASPRPHENCGRYFNQQPDESYLRNDRKD